MSPASTPWVTVTTRDDVGGGGGSATSALRSPTEKVSEPEIGWPSAETTNQPTTWVPCSDEGSSRVMTTSVPVVRADDGTVAPSAS